MLFNIIPLELQMQKKTTQVGLLLTLNSQF